jgi:hypothetical protein
METHGTVKKFYTYPKFRHGDYTTRVCSCVRFDLNRKKLGTRIALGPASSI